ncbi:MAG: ELWxxDGT repeat protein [Acidobacteriota bacterium]
MTLLETIRTRWVQARPRIAFALLIAFAASAASAASAESGGEAQTQAELVADLGPPPGRPGFLAPRSPIRIGNRILFFASDEVASTELWATDGTTAGTLRVRDVRPGIDPGSFGYAFGMVAARDRGFFQTADPLAGLRLWVTDGTRPGTTAIFSAGSSDIGGPGVPAVQTAAIGRDLFFLRTIAESRLEVWRSDGTENGARRLAELPTTAPGVPAVVVQAAGRVYFTFQGINRRELWTSDGTEQGTLPLAVFASYPMPGFGLPAPVAVGSRLYFVDHDPDHGYELWTSDGTIPGTRLVRDFTPGRQSSSFSFLAAVRNAAFFAIGSREGAAIWRSDGTEAGTVSLAERTGNGIEPVAPLGGQLLFAQDGALWRTQGEHPPLRLAESLFPCGGAATAGNRVYFAARDSGHGCELWRTDGTPEGTALAFDAVPGENSSEPEPHALGGRILLFSRTLEEIRVVEGDRVRTLRRPHTEFRSGAPAFLTPLGTGLAFGANGTVRRALWRTDGSAEGTVSIESGPGWFFDPALPSDLTALGTRLAFRTPAGIEVWDGLEHPGAVPVLVAADGLGLGYSLDRRTLFRRGNRAYWLALSPGAQFPAVPTIDLWSTDGTLVGSGLVKSLFPAPFYEPGGIYVLPDFFAVANDTALSFFFYSGGSEIWTTDGTAEGTREIFDLSAADDEAAPRLFDAAVPFAEGLLFITWGPQSGIQIWRTDVTPQGAHVIEQASVTSIPQRLTRSGNLAYFTAEDDSGTELWATDGTPSGARKVLDLAPGPISSFPQELTPVGDRLFFTADDGIHGREIWSSDGTAEGTSIVTDVAPGRATSFPQHLAAIGGGDVPIRLAFAADDGLHGLEPWTASADGTASALFADVAPGDASSSPAEFTSVGNRLYFAAGIRRTGRELWKATIPP